MSTMSELKAEYESSRDLENDYYTTWRSRDTLIAISAMTLAEGVFKDHPSFDYIRQLVKESNEARAQYLEQFNRTAEAFERYNSAFVASTQEVRDVH